MFWIGFFTGIAAWLLVSVIFVGVLLIITNNLTENSIDNIRCSPCESEE